MRARSNACWSPPAKSVLQSTDYSAVNDSGGVRGSDPQDLRPRFRRLGGMSVDKRMGRPSRLHPDCIPGLCGRGAFNSEPRFRFRACAAVVFATFSGSISRFLAGAPAPCCDGHRKEKRETEGFPYRHKATERSVNARAWIGCSKEASPMPLSSDDNRKYASSLACFRLLRRGRAFFERTQASSCRRSC